PELARLLRVLDGTKTIRSRRDQGFLRVLASDDSKQGGKSQGFNPTLAIIDELHAHENDNLYVDMRSGLFKRGGLLVVITTAGWDLSSVLGLLRTNFLEADQHGGTVETGLVALDDGNWAYDPIAGRLTVATIGRSAMAEWALRPKGHPLGEDDPNDMAVVKLANPASWVTIESLEDARDAPGITPWAFRRYRANLWTLAFESWLPDGAWQRLTHPDVVVLPARSWLDASGDEVDEHVSDLFPSGVAVNGAIDMARYRDCAAFTLIGPGPDGRRLVRSMIWRSGGPNHPVPYGPVERAACAAHGHYKVASLGLDMKYLDQMYATLESDGLAVESFPQSPERMCPAAANLRQAIVTDQRFVHDGDAILTAHIVAAVAKDVGEGAFRLVKSKANGPPIDGCVSLAMANELDLADHDVSMYESEDVAI
ncbi:MAG: terminase large subunit domain-containing protein, partial [Panacagrimonas sp.]